MAKFVPGMFLENWGQYRRRESTVQFSNEQLTQAKNGIRKMTDVMDEIDKVLADHGEAIDTIEGLMGKFAEKAASSVDSMRLQAVRDTLQAHTARLAALLQKYPVVK